jgi:hypothetical protein
MTHKEKRYLCFAGNLGQPNRNAFVHNKQKPTVPHHCENWKSNPPSGNSYPLNDLQTWAKILCDCNEQIKWMSEHEKRIFQVKESAEW